jgi:hypothetical protein
MKFMDTLVNNRYGIIFYARLLMPAGHKVVKIKPKHSTLRKPKAHFPTPKAYMSTRAPSEPISSRAIKVSLSCKLTSDDEFSLKEVYVYLPSSISAYRVLQSRK